MIVNRLGLLFLCIPAVAGLANPAYRQSAIVPPLPKVVTSDYYARLPDQEENPEAASTAALAGQFDAPVHTPGAR